MTNNEIIKQVLKHYNNYKTFIKCDDMPTINVIPVSMGKTGSFLAKVSFHIPYNRTFDMQIYREAYVLHGEKLLPTLYHEFTHVFDLSHYGLHIDPTYRADYLDAYTEYHASIIELITATHISTANTQNKLDAKKSLFYLNGSTKNITTHIWHRLDALQKQMTKTLASKTEHQVEKTIDYIMYAIGDALFCDKYVNDYQYPLEKLLSIVGRYAIDVKDIMSLIIISEKQGVTKETLDHLLIIRKAMIKSMAH